MSFLAGTFVGAALILVIWVVGRNRRSAPVLRPSTTAGLEGLNAFPEPIALTEGDKVVFTNTAFRRDIRDLSAGQTWPQWLACLEGESRLTETNAPPVIAQKTGGRAETQIRTRSKRLLAWTAVPYPGMGRRLMLNIVRDVTASAGVNYDQALFMNRAAHELKTPATAIKGYAELMQMYVASGRPISGEIADRIVQQTNRLVHLVNQLLDVARLGAGRLRDEPERLDFNESLNTILQKVRESFPGRVIRLQSQVEGPALLDADRLAQVVRELLFNALQYSPPDTPVDVRAFRNHDFVTIEVTDHGIGIPTQEIETIEERFIRGSNVGLMAGAGGFGLGLFIANGILESWHGDLKIASEPGRGTTVAASWPWRPAPEAHAHDHQDERRHLEPRRPTA